MLSIGLKRFYQCALVCMALWLISPVGPGSSIKAQGVQGEASVLLSQNDTPPPATNTPMLTENTIYYMSPTGDDTRAGTSEAEAWATFDRAWQALHPGDTLVLLDGIYYQSLRPNKRNGEPGRLITVRAQNDGKVIVDGEYRRVPLKLGDTWPGPIGNYFVIEGLVLKNSSYRVVEILGNHNTLRRVSAYNANVDSNTGVISVSGNYNLLEDCVASGTGRKMIYTFKGEHNIFRRCFAAWKQWDGREMCNQEWPNGTNLQLYNANHNIIENGISFGGAPKWSVSMGVNGPTSSSIGNRILGTISIQAGLDWQGNEIEFGNRPPPCTTTAKLDEWLHYRVGFHTDNHEVAQAYDNVFRDILSWGNGGEGITYGRGGDAAMVDHATIFGNLGIGQTQGKNPNLGPKSEEKFTAITNSYIQCTAYQGEGARLSHRYVDGVLTDEPLWPWPMEERIQAELGISVTETVSGILALAEDRTCPGGNPQPTPIPTPIPTTPPNPTPNPGGGSSANVFLPAISR